MVHRIGVVPVGEASVGIAVSAAHRAEAFEACHWLIDRLKEIVPIWKKEHYRGGAVWIGAQQGGPQTASARRARRQRRFTLRFAFPQTLRHGTREGPSCTPATPPSLVLALATVSGCAAAAPALARRRGRSAPGADPAERGADGRVRARRGGAAAERHRHGGRRVREGGARPIPNTPMLRLRLATLYVRTGKLDKAREQCERVVAAEPDNLDALALLAGIDTRARPRRRRDRHLRARPGARSRLSRRPTSISARSTESAATGRSGDRDAAAG